jgi:hypothetical protein
MDKCAVHIWPSRQPEGSQAGELFSWEKGSLDSPETSSGFEQITGSAFADYGVTSGNGGCFTPGVPA